jgi:hypothetical protein
MNWLECLYCGKQWRAQFYKIVPSCPKCNESKSIRVLKKGERHNKYYEGDPEPTDGAKNDFKDYKDFID